MKTKILPALFEQALCPMLLISKQEVEWANAAFRHLPDAHRKRIQEWGLHQDQAWLELDTGRFQRLSAKSHQLILGHPADASSLQRTLLLKLLPALQAGGDPYLNTASVLGPLLGWKHCVVAKRKTARSVDLLGHWQEGKLQPPSHQSLSGSAAQTLYEGETGEAAFRALGREFPLDPQLKDHPSDLWIGHRIDLPEQPGLGHICVWGQPDFVDADTCAWLIGLSADILSSWLLSHLETQDKDYEPSLEARDPLTGLPGRKSFDLALRHAMQKFQQQNQDVLVTIIDIQELNKLNDQHGSSRGDRLIHDLGQALLGICRRKDQVFRLGGDEFLLLMPTGQTLPPVSKRLERICTQLRADDLPDLHLNHALCTLSEAKGSGEELMLILDQRLKACKDAAQAQA